MPPTPAMKPPEPPRVITPPATPPPLAVVTNPPAIPDPGFFGPLMLGLAATVATILLAVVVRLVQPPVHGGWYWMWAFMLAPHAGMIALMLWRRHSLKMLGLDIQYRHHATAVFTFTVASAITLLVAMAWWGGWHFGRLGWGYAISAQVTVLAWCMMAIVVHGRGWRALPAGFGIGFTAITTLRTLNAWGVVAGRHRDLSVWSYSAWTALMAVLLGLMAAVLIAWYGEWCKLLNIRRRRPSGA